MELMLMINEKIGSYAFHLDIGYFPPRGIPVYGTGYWILSIWLFCWILDILLPFGIPLCAFVSSCENMFNTGCLTKGLIRRKNYCCPPIIL